MQISSPYLSSHCSQILSFLFFYFNHISINDASVGLITFDNISSIDLDLLIILGATYGAIYFIPVIISLYFVQTQSRAVKDERAFNEKWYRWSKQYIWHEYMFRTNIIIIISLIVIFIFEPEWPFWAPFAIIGAGLFMCLLSKCVSSCIKPRILTKAQEKRFHKMTMDESFIMHRDSIYGSECWDDNDDYSYNDDAYLEEPFTRPPSNTFPFKNKGRGHGSNMISRMSFGRNKTKSYNDTYEPLLGDYNQETTVELLRVN